MRMRIGIERKANMGAEINTPNTRKEIIITMTTNCGMMSPEIGIISIQNGGNTRNNFANVINKDCEANRESHQKNNHQHC